MAVDFITFRGRAHGSDTHDFASSPLPPHVQGEKPSKRVLAMDLVAAGGRGSGRGSGRGRSFENSKGYAAHAASPSSSHKKGRGRSDSDGGGARERDSPSTTRDDFKEYALALRKRDRRGRPDEPVEPRERGGGKFRREKDYTQVSLYA